RAKKRTPVSAGFFVIPCVCLSEFECDRKHHSLFYGLSSLLARRPRRCALYYTNRFFIAAGADTLHSSNIRNRTVFINNELDEHFTVDTHPTCLRWILHFFLHILVES